MNVSRHLYAIGGIMAVLTAASFGTSHIKRVPAPSNSNVVVTITPAQPVPIKDVNAPIPVQQVARTGLCSSHPRYDGGSLAS